MRVLGAWRASAPPRHASGARLRPRGRAVSTARPLGRHLQDQRRLPALARPGVPRPARARDVVLPRVYEPAQPQDPARILGALRPAPRGTARLGERRQGRVGGRSSARRHSAFSFGKRSSSQTRVAPRSVRAARRRVIAVPHTARAHREGEAAEGEARCRGEKARQEPPLEGAAFYYLYYYRYFFSSSTLPIFSTAAERRFASRSQYFANSGASR